MLLLGLIFGFAVWQYVVSTPEMIANENPEPTDEIEGYWGEITGDFDWCELNYVSSFFVAEPFNTFSSLLYVLVPAMALIIAPDYLPPTVDRRDFVFLAVIEMCIGIGSALFHATLLYEMQLMDEIPMFWFISFTAVLIYTREEYQTKQQSIKDSKMKLYRITALVTGITSVVLLTTAKQSVLHLCGRIVSTGCFVGGFVYIFYVSVHLKNELLAKDPTSEEMQRITKLFDKVFDNTICALHN